MISQVIFVIVGIGCLIVITPLSVWGLFVSIIEGDIPFALFSGAIVMILVAGAFSLFGL